MVYPSSFAPQVRWLRSFTRITYQSKLIGILSLAAFLQPEIYRVYLNGDYQRQSFMALLQMAVHGGNALAQQTKRHHLPVILQVAGALAFLQLELFRVCHPGSIDAQRGNRYTQAPPGFSSNKGYRRTGYAYPLRQSCRK